MCLPKFQFPEISQDNCLPTSALYIHKYVDTSFTYW